jgi:hypothetical protein
MKTEAKVIINIKDKFLANTKDAQVKKKLTLKQILKRKDIVSFEINLK